MEWNNALSHFSSNFERIAEYYEFIAEQSEYSDKYYFQWMHARAIKYTGVSFETYSPLYIRIFEQYPSRAEVMFELAENSPDRIDIYEKIMYLPTPPLEYNGIDVDVYKWKILVKYIELCISSNIQKAYDAWIVLNNRGFADKCNISGDALKSQLYNENSYHAFSNYIKLLPSSDNELCTKCGNEYPPAAGDKKGIHVPNIIHIMWVKGNRTYSMVQYLTIRAAAAVQKPNKIYVYNDEEPVNNEWWELSRKYIEIVHISPPRSINNHPLQWAQHIADVMRVCIMYHRGGIYLDSDLLLLKPLKNILVSDRVTMCKETDNKIWNGFIASAPGNNFFKRWLREYETKYGTSEGGCWWAGLSVETPMRLYKADNSEVNLIDTQILLPFGFYDDTIYKFYSEGMYECSLAAHLWETEAEKRGVLPKSVEWFSEHPESAFAKFFGKYIEDI